MYRLLLLLPFVIGACGTKVKPASVATSQPENQWIILFDGTSLDQWHGYNNGNEVFENWSIDDGNLLLDSDTPQMHSLVTNQSFTSFVLSIDWKASEMTNSGIFWGVDEDPKYKEPYETGIEAQVMDNGGYPDKPMINKAGSIYNLVAASTDVAKPAGEWNNYIITIDHEKNNGSVQLNGVVTAEFPVSGPKWDSLVSNSKFASWEGFAKKKTGKIGLQEFGFGVAYRNIKIKELN